MAWSLHRATAPERQSTAHDGLAQPGGRPAPAGARCPQYPDRLLARFAIRFDYARLWEQFSLHWMLLPVALLLKLPIFAALGLYRRLWHYASVGEVLPILVAYQSAVADDQLPGLFR